MAVCGWVDHRLSMPLRLGLAIQTRPDEGKADSGRASACRPEAAFPSIKAFPAFAGTGSALTRAHAIHGVLRAATVRQSAADYRQEAQECKALEEAL